MSESVDGEGRSRVRSSAGSRSDQEGWEAAMPDGDFAIARVVVEGCPFAKPGGENFRQARRMLLGAFADNH